MEGVDITTGMQTFQTIAQAAIIPFIIGIVSAIRNTGKIPSGYTPLLAMGIGSVIGVATYLGLNGFSVMSIVMGVLLGGTTGLAAVGAHQMATSKPKYELDETEFIPWG